MNFMHASNNIETDKNEFFLHSQGIDLQTLCPKIPCVLPLQFQAFYMKCSYFLYFQSRVNCRALPAVSWLVLLIFFQFSSVFSKIHCPKAS